MTIALRKNIIQKTYFELVYDFISNLFKRKEKSTKPSTNQNIYKNFIEDNEIQFKKKDTSHVLIVYDKSNIESVITSVVLRDLLIKSGSTVDMKTINIDNLFYSDIIFVMSYPENVLLKTIIDTNVDVYFFNNKKPFKSLFKVLFNTLGFSKNNLIIDDKVIKQLFTEEYLNLYSIISIAIEYFYYSNKISNFNYFNFKNKHQYLLLGNAYNLLEYQSLLYNNYKDALAAIDTGIEYVFKLETSLVVYKNYLKELKEKIAKDCYIDQCNILQEQRIEKLISVNINITDMPFALKIIKNSYKNILLFEEVKELDEDGEVIRKEKILLLSTPNKFFSNQLFTMFRAYPIYTNQAYLLKSAQI